jgi:hypothetical protein
VFCSRGLKGKGLESEVATLKFFGFGMTGRGILLGPEELDALDSGSEEDVG